MALEAATVPLRYEITKPTLSTLAAAVIKLITGIQKPAAVYSKCATLSDPDS